MKQAIWLVGVPFLLLFSCAKQESAATDAPHATVTMRDGTRVAGSVTSSSPSEITIVGDDKQTRTISMKDVRRVEYSDPSASREGSGPDVAHEGYPRPQPSAIRTKTNLLASGTQITVRNEETIDSAVASEGQVYAADVTQDVLDASGDVVIPRGSNALIVIRSATKGGKIKGASDLVLDLQSVSVGGQRYNLSTEDLEHKGRDGVGANKRTGVFTGGGAAVGAIIGAIAGGGKGAAIGAASGAGAGATAQILTKGSIKVPVESLLTFRLDNSLRVAAAR